MKLAEIQGERAIDVAADLIDPIVKIAADDCAADLFRRRPLPDGMTAREFILCRLQSGLPALLRNHKAEIVKILSVIKDEPEQEVFDNMTLVSLVNDLSDMLSDNLLRAFFGFAQTRQTSSESVPKNTEEAKN